MLSTAQAVILGIVEGITEFLPISSTAHLILASDLMKLAQTDFMKSFEIIIQLGAIAAVVLLYWRSFLDWEVLKRLAVAFVPTGVLGLILYKLIKAYLLGNTNVVLWSLVIGGIFLIVFERRHSSRNRIYPVPTEVYPVPTEVYPVPTEVYPVPTEVYPVPTEVYPVPTEVYPVPKGEIKNISYQHCLIIGLCQSVAMVPGVSRSAATIVGGLALGLKRKTIVEFSFLLAVPTMLAATGLDLIKNAGSFSVLQANSLGIGFAVSFVMAIVGIKFLLSYIQKNSFTAFGIYRIIIVALFLL